MSPTAPGSVAAVVCSSGDEATVVLLDTAFAVAVAVDVAVARAVALVALPASARPHAASPQAASALRQSESAIVRQAELVRSMKFWIGRVPRAEGPSKSNEFRPQGTARAMMDLHDTESLR